MSQQELTYGDPDNPWQEEDEWWHISGQPKIQLLRKSLRICGRSSDQFKSEREKKRWKNAAKFPDEWLENCMGWAGKKNSRNIVIKFDALLSAMLNRARFEEWAIKNGEADVINTFDDNEIVGNLND